MRLLRTSLLAAALAAPLSAHAFTLVDVASDAALLALLGGPGEPNLAFVAEGRVGNAASNGTFELDIGASTAAPADTDQFAWGNGQRVAFTLSFDAGTRLASLAFASGTPSVSYTVPATETFTDLFFRARSVSNGSLLLSGLALDGVSFGQDVGVTGAGLDFLQLAGGGLADGFVLTGFATLAWTGTAPTNSNLAFQIKLGDVPQIPEPSTYALVLAGLAGLGFLARRRRV
jgi:hypothetical protein